MFDDHTRWLYFIRASVIEGAWAIGNGLDLMQALLSVAYLDEAMKWKGRRLEMR